MYNSPTLSRSISFHSLRYTVAQDNIPSFLEHLAERILQTGKYLNVVRECGLEVACPGAKGERRVCVGV